MSDGGRPVRYAGSPFVARDWGIERRTTDAPGPRSAPMTGSTSSASADRGLLASTKRLTLVATVLGSSIAILDGRSVVSVALPSIQGSLGGGLAGEQWVSNAYLLMLGSVHPPRRIAGRHLRRAAGVRAGRGRVRRDVAAVRRRPV